MLMFHRIFARLAMAGAAVAMVVAGNFACIRQPAYVDGPQLAAPTGPGSPTANGNNFTAAVAIGGSLDFSASATDPNAGDTLTITATITGGSLTAAQAGFVTAFPASMTGTSPQTLDFSGTAAMIGSIEITVVADDGANTDAWVMTIQIGEAPSFTNAPPTVAVVGEPWSFTPTATGIPAPSISVSGQPAWLAWNGNTLSGTPAPIDKGTTATITFTASNGVSPAATLPFTIAVCDWTTMASGTSEHLRGVWGSSPTDVFAVGDNGTILHFDGNTWTTMASGTSETLVDVWGSSSADVFAVGANGTIRHYNGTAWSAMSSGTSETLSGVWGTSTTDVFAVGGNGTIRHYNGTTWNGMTSGTSEYLQAVSGVASNDVFAVGRSGTILQYNGATWSAMSSGTIQIIYSVWGISATEVFAVGDFGTIRRFDGSTWNAMSGAGAIILFGVWGTSTTNVFAVGQIGRILHFDGASWSSLSVPTSNDLYAVWGSSPTNVFVVGESGIILHFGP